jgi:hypothetical protein
MIEGESVIHKKIVHFFAERDWIHVTNGVIVDNFENFGF